MSSVAEVMTILQKEFSNFDNDDMIVMLSHAVAEQSCSLEQARRTIREMQIESALVSPSDPGATTAPDPTPMSAEGCAVPPRSSNTTTSTSTSRRYQPPPPEPADTSSRSDPKGSVTTQKPSLPDEAPSRYDPSRLRQESSNDKPPAEKREERTSVPAPKVRPNGLVGDKSSSHVELHGQSTNDIMAWLDKMAIETTGKTVDDTPSLVSALDDPSSYRTGRSTTITQRNYGEEETTIVLSPTKPPPPAAFNDNGNDDDDANNAGSLPPRAPADPAADHDVFRAESGGVEVIFYTTSVHPTPSVKDHCRGMKFLLDIFMIPHFTMDLSMEEGGKFIRKQLIEACGGKDLGLPLLFVGERFVGTFPQCQVMVDNGNFELILESMGFIHPLPAEKRLKQRRL